MATIRFSFTVYVLVCGCFMEEAEGTLRRPYLHRRRPLAGELVVPVALGKGCTQRREVIVSRCLGSSFCRALALLGDPSTVPGSSVVLSVGQLRPHPALRPPCCFVWELS